MNRRTHFRTNLDGRSACNQAWSDQHYTTDDPLAVDCERCRSSYTWRQARVRLVLPAIVR